MAKIVLGLATSHGPQLLTPPQHWSLREEADRKNTSLYFDGQIYTFDQLAQHRCGDGIAEKATPQARRAHFDRCQAAMVRLAEVYARAQPDVAVILGNDQFEVFTEVNIPAFSVFWGEYVEGIPKTPEQRAMIPAGAAFAEEGYYPAQRTRYACDPQLGKHVIERLILAEFDIAQSTRLPVGRLGNNSVPHAYGYIYRQVMRDQVIPHVPVMINTHNPPNRPTARRCLDFGRVLASAIESWPSEARVAVIASGGLTHYVIDEGLDRDFLDAAKAGDHERIVAIPENRYEAGTAEIKNWLPLVGAMTALGLPMTLVDYVPCYRSEAGTGNAMGFAYWEKH
jgi:hypothetical protein